MLELTTVFDSNLQKQNEKRLEPKLGLYVLIKDPTLAHHAIFQNLR